MKKKHLMICNMALLAMMPIVTANAIMLECSHGEAFCGMENTIWTWLHIISSTLLLGLTIWHIHLNWNRPKTWVQRFKTHHSIETKSTVISFLLTILTGIIAIAFWMTHGHTGVGGIHGKLGLFAVACMAYHILQRRAWYARRFRKQL